MSAITLVIGLLGLFGSGLQHGPARACSRWTPNLLNVFVSVVFVNSPGVFRIVRGLVMDIKARDYVAAGQTRGESPWYIMLWEILPNARGPLIVDFCLRIGYTTILLGTLGFFGLGVSPESPDWGSTIDDGRRLLSIYPAPCRRARLGADEPGPRPEPAGRRLARRKPEGLMRRPALHLGSKYSTGVRGCEPPVPPLPKRGLTMDHLGRRPNRSSRSRTSRSRFFTRTARNPGGDGFFLHRHARRGDGAGRRIRLRQVHRGPGGDARSGQERPDRRRARSSSRAAI